MRFDFKKLSIDLLIIVGFLVISLLYCFPQLQGKKLNQHDNVSWQGMAREAMAYHDSTGKDVLWSNSMFGGMPSYTAYVGAKNVNYPGYVQIFLQSVGKPAYFFFIAMLCFYVLLRVFNVNRWLAMVGSLAYAFSSYNAIIIAVGHDTKMMTLAYMPAALAGLYLIFKEKWLPGAALLAVSVSLIFGNNHFQVIYYFLIMFGCFAIVMFIIALLNGRIRQYIIALLIAAAAAGIGAGPSTSSLLTTSEYAKETMRGGGSELSGHDKKTNGGLDKEYAFRWSNGIGETFCIMIPYLYGGSSDEAADKAPKTSEAAGDRYEKLPLYWGPQPFISGPVYFGAVICFLFLLGLLVVRSPHKWWMLTAAVISIVLSWGKNFEAINYFLFDHLPMLNKFRTPSMALVVAQFVFPLLGIWAVQEVLDRKDDPKIWKNILIAAGITGGLCLLIGVGGSTMFDFTSAADGQIPRDMLKLLKQDRSSLAMMSALKSTVYILIAGGLLWAFVKNKIKMPVLIAGLGLVIAIDMIPVAYDYLNGTEHNEHAYDNYVDASDYEKALAPREVDLQILKDRDPYYRVLDLSKNTYNDAVQAYFHKCIGGYHPAKMEIYQDLIDRQMGGAFNPQVLNMLNTKYIIFPGGKGEFSLPNADACGNAWFVDEVKWANTADEEMNFLNVDSNLAPKDLFEHLRLKVPGPKDSAAPVVTEGGGFKPLHSAVIRNTFKNDFGNATVGKDAGAYVKLTQYGLDDLTFHSKNGQAGLAVFSDIYYSKGWTATVDGNPTPIMRANYVLRAIKVPAGEHTIEFHFRPASFYTGQKVALICSILEILLCLGAFYPLLRKETMPAQPKA